MRPLPELVACRVDDLDAPGTPGDARGRLGPPGAAWGRLGPPGAAWGYGGW
jgi:hypothetical protein